MGQAASLIRACNCCKCMSDFNRYVLNSLECESTCMNCCEVSLRTDQIELSDSEEELEVEGCVKWRKG